MVRAAIAEGMEKPDDGVAFINAKFGFDLPKPMWSSYRAQQKARDKKQAGGEEPARKPRGPAAKPVSNGEMDVISALEALKPLVRELGGGEGPAASGCSGMKWLQLLFFIASIASLAWHDQVPGNASWYGMLIAVTGLVVASALELLRLRRKSFDAQRH